MSEVRVVQARGLENLMLKLIEKAKRRVILAYERSAHTDRPWLEASPPDSYSSPNYRVKVFVLEGSPPKGMVLANYGGHVAIAFDCHGRQLYTYRDFGVES